MCYKHIALVFAQKEKKKTIFPKRGTHTVYSLNPIRTHWSLCKL